MFSKDLSPYTKIISYGGVQSNAMLSVAAFAHSKKIPFEYHVRYIPKNLTAVKSNLTYAQELGMQLIITQAQNDDVLGELIEQTMVNEEIIYIKQGGAVADASIGIVKLAQEIVSYLDQSGHKQWKVALPSGTGTTALFLQKALYGNVEVLTTACVGSKGYLEKEFSRLEPDSKYWPTILETQGTYPFAKPHIDLYKRYESFKKQAIEFDLIYAPVMWQALEDNKGYWENSELLYIHSGGVLGNESQKHRYQKILVTV